MKVFDVEIMIEATVSFSTTGEPAKLYSPPHETADIKNIKAFTYTTIKALQEAIEHAKATGLDKPGAIIPIDVYGGLCARERQQIERSCEEALSANTFQNKDH